MAFNYSPKIVTDGLVLCLDAANTKSYPGSGTVWSDLSRGGNNGTLTNGPTFNSANGGSIVFDGVNDIITTSNNSVLTQAGNTQFTVDFWVKKSASNKDMSIGTFNNSIITGWFFQWFTNNTVYFGICDGSFKFNSTPLIWQNQWYNMVAVFNGSLGSNQDIGKIYVNSSILTTSNSNNMVTSVPVNTLQFTIGGLTNYSSFSGGNISAVKLYNRALSSTEILQNYNATKSRFGL